VQPFDTDPWTVVARANEARTCADLVLVLEARGIAAHQQRVDSVWLVLVAPDDAAQAARELDVYARENANTAHPSSPPTVGSGWIGVASFVAVLTIVAVLVQQLAFDVDWLAVGRMDAGLMLAGQWWRPVTALTLHVDADHLLGNIAFGALFTYFVGRYLGGGVGWIAILCAGTLGNVVNGWAQAPDHRAIGASTAVFGALGLLTAYTWRRGFPAGTSFRGRVAPLIAGIGLLAYTGTGGPNTDIGAHFMGFVMGFAAGLVAARFPVSGSPRLQIGAALLAWLLVIGAWWWGIAATR
jgi:membrane associated rhomboid family serine protease